MRPILALMLAAAGVATPALATPATATPARTAPDPVVRIDSGVLQGVAEPGATPLHIFRGIPFAAPPLAALRWRAPQPVPEWRGVRPATAFAPRCMQQPLFADMMFRSPAPSEDCLYLNVWAPAAARRAKLPVLLYVHGGGFVAGDGSEKRYDGAALAARGVIVVTLNYRLGVFGFLAHPDLTATSPNRASGNYGLLDQAAALAWVRRNIAAFGGDPRRITIGGESAGSMSVSALMTSPLTRGSIVGAIGESGALMHALSPPPRAAGEQTGVAFANRLGAPSLAALRALPADALLAAQASARDTRFSPVIDGYFLTEAPEATFARAKAARVPLLVGSNSQEAAGSAIYGPGAPTVAGYRAGVARLFGDRAAALLALYPAASDADVLPAATALASDGFLAMATWKWFDLQRSTGAPTYYYAFTRVRPRALSDAADAPSPWGAVHSGEIEYALGNLDANPRYLWSAEDRAVAATMSGYFAAFIKTGTPNAAGLPVWPAASRDPRTIARQIIDVQTRTAPFVEQARYVAADPLLARR